MKALFKVYLLIITFIKYLKDLSPLNYNGDGSGSGFSSVFLNFKVIISLHFLKKISNKNYDL